MDFKVQVASSHDTQSALISNVELELGAAIAIPEEHRLIKTNAARCMANIRGLTNLAFGPDCEVVVYLRGITLVQGGASMVS